MSALKDLRIDLMKLDYVDRQLVVVRPDDVVLKERHEARQLPASADPDAADSRETAVRALAAPIGDAIRTMASRLSQLRANRRNVDVLAITRSEARKLHFPVGHPLDGVVYVGNPAVPSDYFTLADFHRQIFAHKINEAIALVSALGAQSMTVAARHGWSREFATRLNLTVPSDEIKVGGGGQTDTRSNSSREVFYAAELKGSGDPRIPEDLRWYRDEPEWQSFARQRMEHDLREFTLHVRYEEDFSVTANVASEISSLGLNAGGTFERHQSTTWTITATFPPNQPRALRAIKHPFG
jgi:hypothetical protein